MRTFLQWFMSIAFALNIVNGYAIKSPAAEEGYASYYSENFEGKKTASGEIYKKTNYTASHNSLPFGTVVVVTNLSNKKTVKVRINDRGPFVSGRVMDLSYAAAKDLGMLSVGKVKVKIEISGNSSQRTPAEKSINLNVPPTSTNERVASASEKSTTPTPQNIPKAYSQRSERSIVNVSQKEEANQPKLTAKGGSSITSSKPYAIQVASLNNKQGAIDMKRKLEAKKARVHLMYDLKNGTKFYKVLLGPFASKKEAQTYLTRNKSIYSLDGCYVVDASKFKY